MAGLFRNLFSRKEPEEIRPVCSAVICAAGSSSRMNGENKLFMSLAGIPVIARTMLAISDCELIGEIIVVSRSEDIAEIAEIAKQFGIRKLKCVVCGGQSRLLSVINGVAEVSKRYELIAVHDGARPLVTGEVIQAAIDAAQRYGAAAPFVPVKDTVKVTGGGVYKRTLERGTLAAMQTPQVFKKDIFTVALQSAAAGEIEVTDDAQALELIGVSVTATMGSDENIKITTPIDIILAEAILHDRG